MDNLHIVYSPRPDAAPRAELDALAAVYRLVLDCHARKEDAVKDTAIVRTEEEARHVEQ